MPAVVARALVVTPAVEPDVDAAVLVCSPVAEVTPAVVPTLASCSNRCEW